MAESELEPENWLPVPGYGGLYEVSDLGRVRSGSKNPVATLTEAAVIEIRRRFSSGQTPQQIGADFGVSAAHVGKIAHRKRWGWLDDVAGDRAVAV